MELTKVTRCGITADAVDGTKIDDDAIDSEHLAATSVDNAHINDVAASKLTGALPAISAASLTSIPAANITGTLAAVSGANLTALNATNLGSGTVPAARLPAGSVIQTLYLQPTTSSSTSSTTLADTVYTLAITPSATTSKILVNITFGFRIAGASRSSGSIQLLRDSTVVTGSNGEIFQFREMNAHYELNSMAGITWVDSPSTTSATTYKLQHAVGESGGTRIYTYGNTGGFIGSMTLMEIAG